MSQAMKEVFGTVDYLVFAGVLVISAAIGIWYAYADRKKTNTQEFLMGGRSLSVFPVAMSILSSFISAVSLLGAPSEVYRYGTQFIISTLGIWLMVPTTAYLYLPVYHRLRLTSAYEYLERRFHKTVRLMCSVIFILHMKNTIMLQWYLHLRYRKGVIIPFGRNLPKPLITNHQSVFNIAIFIETIYMSVVLYAPALALSEVTGIGLKKTVLSIGLVCTFYTSIGGIKAVVWTDLFQTGLMYTAMTVVIVKGVRDLGGFHVVWERSLKGGRIEFFRFEFDPTIRHTFWSLFLGGYISWMGTYAANQAIIQRYLTISTLKGAQRCLWINLPALMFIVSLASFSGLIIYAYYHNCDPIGAKIVNKPDQVFPRFVMETLGSYPGIPGLFVSGIFSGSLSTVSSGVNSLSAVVLEDFIKEFLPIKLTEIWATRISKLLAVFFGLISVGLVFIAQGLGGIQQVALTIHGVVGGPMLGIFTLGLFFPRANTWGASVGLLSGFGISVWFGVGAFLTKPFSPEAPMSYSNCTDLFYNATNIDLTDINAAIPEVYTRNEHIFYPYKLSYTWLSSIGFLVVLVVGNCVSLLTGPTKNIDKNLLSPLTNWYGIFSPKAMCQRFSTTNEKETSPPRILSVKKIEDFRND